MPAISDKRRRHGRHTVRLSTPRRHRRIDSTMAPHADSQIRGARRACRHLEIDIAEDRTGRSWRLDRGRHVSHARVGQLDHVAGAFDPLSTDVGRWRSAETLPERIRR